MDRAIKRFVHDYDRVAALMAEAAEQIPPGKERYQPDPKCQYWLYLLSHPATHFVIFRKVIEGDPDHGFPTAYRSSENLPANGKAGAAMIRERWGLFRDWLTARPEGFAAKEVAVPWAPVKMTVAQILDWLYEEGVHHRGQAWIYARMNGIKPPSIWGTEG